MLDTDTKKRIDSCRDILVGKVPDPKSQVEQITIALIYKFMDDMDAQSELFGGKRGFFVNGFQKFGWSKLLAPGLGGQETLNLYSEAISKMTENTHLPSLFRDIFKNAYLPYRDPETLKAFLKEIDGFSYDHSERLGDAFEYLLSVLGSQGDAGQFRTPRHIIDFVVQAVDPTKNERILDPACGTAGFLISAYKHILRENSPAIERLRPQLAHGASVAETSIESPSHYSGSLLTPSERQRIHESIRGYDISPDMVRISLVNLYLHGFRSPLVEEYDTLTQEDHWSEYYDTILANPPFMTPKGGIKPHKKFSLQSKRAELLFLDYIVGHLSPDGKAGVIIPEGIVFVSQSAYTNMRKRLVRDNELLAVIELPHGVFKPYASVKTHVLIVDKQLAKQTDKVLFINVKSDGYTQTDTRQSIDADDLPDALRVLEDFKQGLLHVSRPSGDCPYVLVSKTHILSSANCHLVGRWYMLERRLEDLRARMPGAKSIGEICELHRGQNSNMSSAPGEFPLVVPAIERKTSLNYTFDFKAICIPLVSSSGHGKADIKRLHYQEGKFALADTMCCLKLKDTELVEPRYVYEYLSKYKDELLVPMMGGATNVTLNESDIKKILIPIPPIDEQRRIVRGILAEEAAQRLISVRSEVEFGITHSDEIVSALDVQISSLHDISVASPSLEII
ncbi:MULTISPECIES: N-6 DNA methylase [Pseudomonas]|uniref:N-6 DNA methylase n=1 Tax=Pseudomonas TaxID=286 RepID=UPI000CD48217|nr:MULTISPECIES: N-6 DNA methylase [Pseudomonas]WHL28766.1 N-6 DNA methylase [Pseudomonas juntendi]MBA6140345.1 N-6 DNA methylase [Pseudomonas monteilii]MDT3749955.1 N-6 DNA methylase [Pseudomonas kurunegalensis]POF91939.1 restriction endonuclease subunit S [Pseudomonas putida]WDY58658.1 N-6 DNA methylase [Pseudomonas sp. PSKL.D1]